MEIVKFNSHATLSRQYAILGKVSKKMGKVYKKSGDESLAQLVHAYHIMEKEAKFLSKLVKKQLSTFDMLILKSMAIITDQFFDCGACFWSCTLYIDWGCYIWGAALCYILSQLPPWWPGVACLILFFFICVLPPMTYEECIDWCIEMCTL